MMSDSSQVGFILRYRKGIHIKHASGDWKQNVGPGTQGEVEIFESRASYIMGVVFGLGYDRVKILGLTRYSACIYLVNIHWRYLTYI